MCWGDRAGLQRELKASYDESKLIQRHYCGESETLVQYATCTTRSWTSSAAYNRDIVKKDISEQTFGTYQAPPHGLRCVFCSASSCTSNPSKRPGCIRPPHGLLFASFSANVCGLCYKGSSNRNTRTRDKIGSIRCIGQSLDRGTGAPVYAPNKYGRRQRNVATQIREMWGCAPCHIPHKYVIASTLAGARD